MSLKISIIGIGGAGCQASDFVAQSLTRCKGIEIRFAALDTDLQILERIKTAHKVPLGTQRLKGLGTGGDVELGKTILQEEKSTVSALFQDQNLVFVLCGLGGGLGSAAAETLVPWGAQSGALVLSLPSLPFSFEGTSCLNKMQTALKWMRQSSHGVIPLPNDLLLQALPDSASVVEAFACANAWAKTAIEALLKSFFTPGIINVDFKDLQNCFLANTGKTLFAFGGAIGADATNQALAELQKCPLLHTPHNNQRAQKLFIHIEGGRNLTLKEVHTAIQELKIRFKSDEDTLIGASVEDTERSFTNITVIGVTYLENTGAPVQITTKPLQADRLYQPVFFEESPLAKSTRKGQFPELQSNMVDGRDLDVPTYLRQGIKLEEA